MSFEILPWDSSFFGFRVAKILNPSLNAIELGKILTEIKARDITLVYWPSGDRDGESRQAADQLGGFLADRKITYILELEKNAESSSAWEGQVEPYEPKSVSPDLRRLAVASGVYSRFRTDPRFPKDAFERMYCFWIEKSVQGTEGEKVFVCRSGDRIAGMVTVESRAGRAVIGLIAVDPEFSGKGIGRALVYKAADWGLRNKFSIGQVVTQAVNSPACALYESCGYRIEKIERFYHFWLKEI
jgi:dTDP-4-amino-4,6-dideoxy-D-galactose acyltransferase